MGDFRYALRVWERLRRWRWHLVVAVIAVLAYALLRHQRTELVDFAVPTRAALRAVHAEPLYRPEDGHYQYKYLPAFALAMVPFALPPKAISEPLWFACTVVMPISSIGISSTYNGAGRPFGTRFFQ